jgi:hypothetical protein
MKTKLISLILLILSTLSACQTPTPQSDITAKVNTESTLQTFTDQSGRSPVVQFEGVTNRVEVEEYRLHILGVMPYPQDLSIRIDPSDYQMTLLVANK